MNKILLREHRHAYCGVEAERSLSDAAVSQKVAMECWQATLSKGRDKIERAVKPTS
jgi:hypothetical protein